MQLVTERDVSWFRDCGTVDMYDLKSGIRKILLGTITEEKVHLKLYDLCPKKLGENQAF